MIVLAVALRAPYAGVALSPDEGGVAWVARQWTTGHGSLYGGQWLDRPPLLVAVYRLAVEGAGSLGVRLLGALAASLLILGVWRLAAVLGGAAAGRAAGLLAALLTGSIAISAVYAPAELLAAVPAVGSIGSIVLGHRTGRLLHLALAGALAVAALLVKQSFLDAGAAGAVYLLSRTIVDRSACVRVWASYSAGAALALLPVLAWILLGHVRPGELFDALVGFRAQSLAVLQASNLPLLTRLQHLALPAAGSGLVVLVPVAIVAFVRWRDRVVAATLCAWLGAGLVGVLGGGSYWPHYLIQLLAPAAVGAGVLLARAPQRARRGALLAAVALAAASSSVGGVAVAVKPPRAIDSRIAAYIHDRARRGDTFYALYARADLNQAVGLRTPFPYSWSLMMRARPDAHGRLLRLLRSMRRPTWVVVWQRPSHWHLDPGGAIAAALRHGYRTVHTDYGRRVLLRVDHVPIR